jgi:hypothetical protein
MASNAQGAPREHKRKTWDVKTRDRVYQKESYGIPKKQLEENYSMAWYELLRGRYDYFSSRGTVKMM